MYLDIIIQKIMKMIIIIVNHAIDYPRLYGHLHNIHYFISFLIFFLFMVIKIWFFFQKVMCILEMKFIFSVPFKVLLKNLIYHEIVSRDLSLLIYHKSD